MSGNHNHSHSKEFPLILALLLTISFFGVEIAAGILSKSLALLSDAAHMLTDVVAIAVALISIKISKKPADKKRTFGYYRFEVLAPAFNAILLMLMSIYILYESYLRLIDKNKVEINTYVMLFVSITGLIINVICLKILSHDKNESLNIKGAYLEILSDMISSFGVIIAAIIIKLTHWQWVDSAIAVAIGLWIIPRSWILFKDSINILLEGVPDGIQLEEIKNAILSISGIIGLHDLHVWAIAQNKISLSVHIIYAKTNHYEQHFILKKLRKMLDDDFQITHSTIQFEIEPCEQANEAHHNE
ncbi:cation diffusion facilitator family transporter [Silvanigrella aquatica]|uniref:Cation transporter n=1 Tax=Silvanigrella aquatica TaxID=1915309 RepID=A0A1L4D2B2_9BACT|nr:cation diffusion facilitator family transporter [Silvanigrella aquatica]APJ04334.1 cation transporter [Silvanigrella aquatica]